MAKTIANKLTGSKYYKLAFGDRELTAVEQELLTQFDKEFTFNYDKIGTIIKFIQQGHTNWVEKWNRIKQLTSGSLEMQVILYGEVEGTKKYLATNEKKTAHFDHSHEAQLRRGMLAAKKTTGNKTNSVRSFGYWMKKGMSEDEAKAKVSEIQRTNKLDRYVAKYGTEVGTEKFNERKVVWANRMTDPEIGAKRSLGLWRYIERYGELEGKIKYLAMREKRNNSSRIGKASAESLVAFSNLTKLLEENNIKYYAGVEGNKEWCIYDPAQSRAYFYDLTIPSLSIIIEYHGEAFHPNPAHKDSWATWMSPFTKQLADEVFANDQYKKKLATDKGWTYYEIYSSESKDVAQTIFEHINTLL